MKIIASVLPASGFFVYSPRRMRSARSNSESSSWREKSGMARKSRWAEVRGARCAVRGRSAAAAARAGMGVWLLEGEKGKRGLPTVAESKAHCEFRGPALGTVGGAGEVSY